MDDSADPFCRKEIMENAFYTTQLTMAVYDIAPVLPGHSLIIPRRHVADATALTKEEILDIFYTLKKIAPAVSKIYRSDSYDLTMQVGRHSGMSVPHLHMHYIPRGKDDAYQGSNDTVYDMIEHSKKISRDELKSNVERLRKELEWRD